LAKCSEDAVLSVIRGDITRKHAEQQEVQKYATKEQIPGSLGSTSGG